MGGSGFLRRNARWLLAGFLLSFASSLGQTFFIALFAADLRGELGLTHGGFGGLYTAATMASALVMIWLGKTADTVPFHILAALVLGALAATALAMSGVGSAAMLLGVLFALRLFGQGMPSHVAMTAMARWFAAARGRALAVSGLGRAAGEAALPGIAVALVALVGWRETWVIAAAMTALAILPATVMLLKRPPDPEDGAGAAAGDSRPATAARDWTRAEVIRDPLFYALLFGVVAPPLFLTGVFFHAAHIVTVKGWSMTDYAAAFPAYAVGAVVSGLVAGWAIDRWGSARLLSLTLLPLGAGLAMLAVSGAVWTVYAFMALAGISNGASSTIAGALWAELYGTRYLGAVRALVIAGIVASTAVAPGAMGALIDVGVGIESQLAVAAGYTFAMAALFAVMCLSVPRLARR